MIKIDVRGQVCPVPLIEAKKVLRDIEQDGTVLVIVDNEIAMENLEKMAKEMSCEYSVNVVNEEHYEVKIIKGLGAEEAEENKVVFGNEVVLGDKVIEENENTLVVISSERMGEGSEELGEILIKGFIYALTESEKLPSTIIFYNGGAKLTTKEFQGIEDLKRLEKMGVEILTCGTCLDYYGIKEELAVGGVTNMYSIIEKMNAAHKIIKP